MFVAMIFTLPIIIAGEIMATKAYDEIKDAKILLAVLPQAYDDYNKALRTFGNLAGTFFMLLGVAMLL